jgi:hypothetical protein
MTISVTLNTVGNLQDTSTAQTTLNNNNAAITGGFSTALNVTGDQMKGNLDLNSNQILNLPAPATAQSPVRLMDVTGSSSIASVPPVGTSGAVVPLLNTNNTWSGTNSFATITGTNLPLTNINNTFSGTQSFTTISVSTLTASTISGTISSTGNNAWSGTNTFSSSVYFANGKPWADITAYGAIGNNSHDNSSSIQAAINFMNTNYGGGVVFIPPGNYYVASGITVKGGVILQGSGREASTIQSQTTNAGAPTVAFDSSCLYAGARDLAIFGYNNSAATSPTVSITSGVPVMIRDCTIWFGSSGVSSQGGDGLIENCFILGYTSCLASSGANWYLRCKFDNAGITTTNALALGALNGATSVLQNSFVQCDITGTYSTSVSVIDLSATPLSYNVFESCVFSSPIVIGKAAWTAIIGGELNSTTLTASSSGGVLSVIGSYGVWSAGITTTVATGATKVVSGCYNIT